MNYFRVLYLHFNRVIIDGFIVSEHNDYSDSESSYHGSDYSDREHLNFDWR
jgi:hypothetical protein